MTAREALLQQYKKSYELLLQRIDAKAARGSWAGYEKQLLKEIQKAVRELDKTAAKNLVNIVESAYQAAAGQTVSFFGDAGISLKLGGGLNKRAMSLIAQNAVDSLVQANHYFGRHAQDQLRQIGLEATAEKLSAGQTIAQAKKRLIETLTTEGLQAPVGASGKPMRLEAYAELVARTTTQEATNTATLDTTQQYGHDLVKFTTHYPTCDVCAPVQGRVFSISGKDKRFPPLSSVPGFDHGFKAIHPNCRHRLVPIVWELCTEEEQAKYLADAGKPVKGDTRGGKEVEAYNAAQAKNRKLWQDRRQWERYKVRLGNEAPRTFSSFRRIKNAGSKGWEKLQERYRSAGATLKLSAKSGILNIQIDEFTPCLKDAKTGEILETEVAKFVDRTALKPYTEKAGWNVDWAKMPDDVDVFGLYLKGDSVVQGLVGIKDSPEQQAIYLHWASTAPHNNKLLNDGQQKYVGVGGHLFAIGAEESIKRGYDGYMYGYGANEKVTRHYMEKFGAEHIGVLHPYHIIVDERAARALLDKYNYTWR